MVRYIFKITNKINNKIYIGQTVNPNIRFYNHVKSHLGCNSLKKDIKAFGADNFTFELIEFTKNYIERVKYWISYYNSNVFGYNSNEKFDKPVSTIPEVEMLGSRAVI